MRLVLCDGDGGNGFCIGAGFARKGDGYLELFEGALFRGYEEVEGLEVSGGIGVGNCRPVFGFHIKPSVRQV